MKRSSTLSHSQQNNEEQYKNANPTMNKILRRGFKLLKTRSLSDKLDILSLEKKYNLKTPPMYRLFAKTFYMILHDEGDSILNNESYSRVMFEQDFSEEELFFDNIFSLEFSMSTYLEHEDWRVNGFMLIGSGPTEGGILLSVDNDSLDSIFYSDAGRYVKIANNIFEFFQNVVIIEKDIDKINPEHLYKNWGEDFWRKKE